MKPITKMPFLALNISTQQLSPNLFTKLHHQAEFSKKSASTVEARPQELVNKSDYERLVEMPGRSRNYALLFPFNECPPGIFFEVLFQPES